MAILLLDFLIDTVSIRNTFHVAMPTPKKITKTESELDEYPYKMRLRKGYYHDEQNNIYKLNVVQKVESQIYTQHKTNHDVTGDIYFVRLSQMLLLSSNCNRLQNGSITGFQSLGATGGMKVLMKYIHLLYGSINVYCPSIGWNVHQTIIQNNHLVVKEYNYPFPDSHNILFMNGTEPIHFQKGDVVLFHGCAHNPTGIDPTKDQWHRIIKTIKQYQLIPFFDYAYQGFVSGNVDHDSFAIQLFEREKVETLFAVQSYSKNMGLYDKRIGCASVICSTAEEANNVICYIRDNILNGLYVNGYPPNIEGAQIVIKILSDKANYIAWKQEVAVMHQRIQKIRDSLYKQLTASNRRYNWEFIVQQVGMFAFKLGLFDAQCIAKLRNKFHVYITNEGRIAIGCIANEKQVEYLVNSINSIM